MNRIWLKHIVFLMVHTLILTSIISFPISAESNNRADIHFSYAGILKPAYYLPTYKAELNTDISEAPVVDMSLVGMDVTGKTYNETAMEFRGVRKDLMFKIDGEPDAISLVPLINSVYKESRMMRYNKENKTTISIEGESFKVNEYVNDTWNSVRFYEVTSGVLIKVREYYAMSEVDFVMHNAPPSIPRTSGIDVTNEEYILVPPWVPGPDFNHARFDITLWSKYYSNMNQLPNFTRVEIGGKRHIVNKTTGISFNLESDDVIIEIAGYIHDKFITEEDRLIAAMLLISDPAFVFSPIRELEYLDFESVHGPDDLVLNRINGKECVDDDPISILYTGYGLCGIKSTVLSAVFREWEYQAGRLSLQVIINGYLFEHVVSVVKMSGDVYVFDPMYQEFFFKWDNISFATYNDIKSNPALIKRWGFIHSEGATFEYTIDLLYLNSDKSDMGLEENGEPIVKKSLQKNFTFIFFIALFIMLLTFSINTGWIRRKNKHTRNICIGFLCISCIGLSGIAYLSESYFSEVHITFILIQVIASLSSFILAILIFTLVLKSRKV